MPNQQPLAEAEIPLEKLNLCTRVHNSLKRARFNSVSDLMGFRYEDLLEIKNFGSKSAEEVIEALGRIGMTLPRQRPPRAPTLLERAMKGDATAAKQFLHKAGFTDAQGQLLPQYQPTPDAHP